MFEGVAVDEGTAFDGCGAALPVNISFHIFGDLGTDGCGPALLNDFLVLGNFSFSCFNCVAVDGCGTALLRILSSSCFGCVAVDGCGTALLVDGCGAALLMGGCGTALLVDGCSTSLLVDGFGTALLKDPSSSGFGCVAVDDFGTALLVDVVGAAFHNNLLVSNILFISILDCQIILFWPTGSIPLLAFRLLPGLLFLELFFSS